MKHAIFIAASVLAIAGCSGGGSKDESSTPSPTPAPVDTFLVVEAEWVSILQCELRWEAYVDPADAEDWFVQTQDSFGLDKTDWFSEPTGSGSLYYRSTQEQRDGTESLPATIQGYINTMDGVVHSVNIVLPPLPSNG